MISALRIVAISTTLATLAACGPEPLPADGTGFEGGIPVSYTHLTLPTILLV